MDFIEYQRLVKKASFGKHLPEAIYVHKITLENLPSQLELLVINVEKALKIDESEWDILKLYKRDYKLTLLKYPSFFDEPYPPLHRSYTIDLNKLTVREANYTKSAPPYFT